MATINDKFNKVSDGTGVYPSVASVSVAREKGGDTLNCDDLAGWPKDSVAFFSTFRQNPDGTIDTSTQTDWKGIVQDNVITSVTRLAGAEDSGQLVGDKVMQNPTIGYMDSVIEGLLKSHNPDGTLKNDIIQTSNIANDAISTEKIKDGSVTGDKISDGSIISSKINWSDFPVGDIIISDNGSFDVQKTYPFKIAVIASRSIWGYAGGEFNVDINITPEPTNKKIVKGNGKGGDTIARSAVAFAMFECKANQSYKIGSSMSNAGGASGSNNIIGIVVRTR